MGFRHAVLGSVAVLGLAAAASAQGPYNNLHFDVNQIEVTYNDALATPGGAGTGVATWFTGSMEFNGGQFAGNVLGTTGGVLGGSYPNDAGSPGTLGSLSGELTFVSGVLTGVSWSFSNTIGDTYSTLVVPGGGELVYSSSLDNYSVDGFTFQGVFSDGGGFGGIADHFGDVDVSIFKAHQANNNFSRGLVKNFFLWEGGVGLQSQTTSGDFFVIIPLPGSAGLAMAGIGLIAFRRRRA